MNLLLVFSLVSCYFLAANAIIEIENVPYSYEPNVAYKYKYDAQIITKTSINQEHLIGFRLVADVLFFSVPSQPENSFTVKFNKTELYRLQKLVPHLPHYFVPLEEFEELREDDIQEQINKFLPLPVTVETVKFSGMITTVKTHPTDPFWSVNFKKALLNLINMHHPETRYDFMVDKTYREETIKGKCDVMYKILPSAAGDVFINVVKTPLFNTCEMPSEPMMWWKSLPNVADCVKFFNNSMIQKEESYDYVINYHGDSRRNFMHSASSQTFYSMPIPSLQVVTEQQITASLQKLVFVEEIKSLSSKDVEKVGELVTIPEVLRLVTPTEGQRNNTQLVKAAVSEMKVVVKAMIENLNDTEYRQNTLMHDTQKLVALSRVVKEKHLKDLLHLREFFPFSSENPEDVITYRKFIMDIFPTISTNNSIAVFVKIMEKVIGISPPAAEDTEVVTLFRNDQKLAKMFSMLNFMGKIDIDSYARLMKLISSQEFRQIYLASDYSQNVIDRLQKRDVYESAWLSLGTLTYTTVIKVLNTSEPLKDLPQRMQQDEMFSKEIQNMLDSEDDQIKLLGIMITCNSRSLKNLDSLRNLFQKTESVAIRIQILHAMKKIYPTVGERICPVFNPKSKNSVPCNKQTMEDYRNKIQSFISGIVLSHKIDAEIRIEAYKAFIAIKPNEVQLGMLVHTMVRKPNQQLLSYVYSHMTQMMNNKLPCYYTMVKTIKKFMPFIRPVRPNLWFYNMHYQPMWSDKLALGSVVAKDVFFYKNQLVPKSINAEWEVEYKGQHTQIIEAGVRIEGGHKWLAYIKKFVENYKKVYKHSRSPIDHKILSVLEQSFADADNNESMQDDDNKNQADIETSISIKLALWGSHVGHWRLTPEMLVDLSSDISSLIPRDVKHTSAFDHYLKYPTTSGFILNFNIFNFHYATLTTRLTPEITISPKIDQYTVMKTCVDNHIVKACAMIEGQTHIHPKPIEFLKIDFSGTKTISWSIPEMEHNVLNYSMTARTEVIEVLYQGESKVRENLESLVLEPSLISEPVNDSKEIELYEAGVKVGVDYTYLRQQKSWHKQSLTQLLLSVSNVSISVGPLNDDVKGDVRKIIGNNKCVTTKPDTRVTKCVELTVTDNDNKDISTLNLQVKLNETMLDEVTLNVTRPKECRYFQTLDIATEMDYYWPDRSMTLFDSLDDVFNVDPDAFYSMNITVEIDNELPTEKKLEVKFESNPLTDDWMEEYNKTVAYSRAVKTCMMEANESSSTLDKFFTPSCIKLFNEVNQLKSKTLLITATPESSKFRNALLYLHSAVEQVLSKFWDEHRIVDKEETYARFNWTTLPFTSNVWNLTMETPIFTDRFSYINALPAQVKAIVEKSRNLCEIRRNHVFTLDGMRFSINKTLEKLITKHSCPVVLASDCSTDQTFNVTLFQTEEDKTIRVKVEENLLEITTRLSEKTTTLVLKINDVVLRELADGEVIVPEIYNETLYINRTWDDLYVIKMTTNNVTGESLTLIVGGLEMRTIMIHADVFYREEMCGICGNFDSNAEVDMFGPHTTLPYNESTAIVINNIVPINDQCKLEQDGGLFEKQTTCLVKTDEDKVVLRNFRGRSVQVLSRKHLEKLQSFTCRQLLFSGEKISVYLRNQDIIVSYLHPVKGRMEIRIAKSSDNVLELKQQQSELAQYLKVIRKNLIIFEVPSEKFRLVRTSDKVKIQVSLQDLDLAKGYCNKDSSELQSSTPEFHNCEQYFSTLRSCEVKENTIRQISRQNKPEDSLIRYSSDRLEKMLRSSQAPLVLYQHDAPFPLQVILRLGENRQVLSVVENGKVKFVITKHDDKAPEISEVEKSLKISKIENADSITLRTTSDIQVIVTRQQLLVTEMKELSGDYQASGLCLYDLPEYSKSIPEDVLRRVLQEELSDNFGSLDDSSKTQVNTLFELLKVNRKSNPSACIINKQKNQDLVTYQSFPADDSTPLMTTQMYQKLKRNKNLRCPLRLLKSDKYMVVFTKQPTQSEVVITLLKKNVELKIEQKVQDNEENVVTKMYVNSRAVESYQDDDVHARISNGKKLDFSSNEFKLSLRRDELSNEILTINAFTDHESLEGVCSTEVSPSDNIQQYIDNANLPAGRSCLRELME